MRVAGIALCGGRSSRMGQAKAWLPFGGETLLQRVVRVVRGVADPVVVVAARGQDVPELAAEVRVVRDDVEGKGPLGGLAAGLAALEGSADAAYLTACDAPFLAAAFVRGMAVRLGDAEACVPRVGGFDHPLAAVYRVSVLGTVRKMLAAGNLRMLDLLSCVTTRVVPEDEIAEFDPDFRSLRNVNSPEEYRAALIDHEEV